MRPGIILQKANETYAWEGHIQGSFSSSSPFSYMQNTWSDTIGTSSRTLIRLFRKETGLSYRGWIQHMHIVFALSQLAEGEAVSRIATSLGYASPSAFSAMFKRHLGYSPQNFK